MPAEFSVNEIPIVIEQSNDLSLVPSPHVLNNKSTSLRTASVPLTEAEFIVTEKMIEPLSRLGFNCNLGQAVEFKKLKECYRKALLQAHPDKGGDERAFQEIKAAHDLLYQHIFNQVKSGGNKFTPYFYEVMKYLNEMYLEQKRSWDDLKNQFKEFGENLQSSSDEWRKIKELYAESANRFSEQNERFSEQGKRLSEQGKELKQLKTDVNNFEEKLTNFSVKLENYYNNVQLQNNIQPPDLTAGIGEGGIKEAPGQETESVEATSNVNNRNSLNAFFKRVESSLVGGNNPMGSSENNKNANFIPKRTE